MESADSLIPVPAEKVCEAALAALKWVKEEREQLFEAAVEERMKKATVKVGLFTRRFPTREEAEAAERETVLDCFGLPEFGRREWMWAYSTTEDLATSLIQANAHFGPELVYLTLDHARKLQVQ